MLHSRSLQVVSLTVFLTAAAGLPAFAQFETRGSFQVLESPISIAVGDFNRDGKSDIAVATSFNGGVAILLGNGDGTFKPATYYTVGAAETTRSIVSVDLRGKGILDLVVINDLDNALEVLVGKGDGTFGPAVSYATPDSPAFVGAGDFNGDHILDLVTIDQSGICPCISVLIGNGDGTFREPPINTMPPDPAASIGIGDFNHDGKLDLVTVGQFGSASEAGVLLGNGDGTFTPGMTYVVGSNPQSVAVADLNGDHNLDLAVADAFGGSIDILLGNGDGTFNQGAVIPTLSFPGGIQKSDFNGDHKVDLVIVTGLSNTVVSEYLGNGDGTFQAALNFPVLGEAATLGVGDFNGDHHNDIVVTNFNGNSVVTLLNTGTVRFSPTTPLNFHKQTVGTTSVPQTIKMTNAGKNALAISSMTLKGQFDMSSTCGKHVAPGAKCAIRVTFSPKTLGAKSGTISIIDSASSQPQVIVLSGTGS
jgi:large repetitive protein